MKIPKIAQNSAIYIVFNVLQKTINFFLLPLYTIYLTPEDYGITNVLVSVSALLTFLLTFSVQAASARFHFRYYRDEGVVKKIWGTNIVFILVNSFFWIVFLCIFYDYSLIYLIGNEISFYPYALLGILNCCFSPIYLYFQTYLQTTQRAKYYVINNLAFFLFQLFLTILFVANFKWGATGVIFAQVIVNFIFSIYALLSLRRFIIYTFSLKILRRSLSYSIPLTPHMLSGWLNGMLDKLFINRIVDLASVGLYSISYQFGMIINMLGLGVNQAFTPWFFKNHDHEDGRRLIVIMSDLTIMSLCIISFCCALFSQEILTIMTSETYHSIWPSIIVLVFANLFDTYYYFYVSVLFLDKTKVLSVISITCSVVTCLINIALISLYGYIGAAYSYFIVQLVKSIFVRYYAYKYRSDINFHSILHYTEALVAIIVTLISLSILQNITLSGFIFKVLIFTIFVMFYMFVNRTSILFVIERYLKNN